MKISIQAKTLDRGPACFQLRMVAFAPMDRRLENGHDDQERSTYGREAGRKLVGNMPIACGTGLAW